jgi:DNA-binding GntR family transcriptional regulator
MTSSEQRKFGLTDHVYDHIKKQLLVGGVYRSGTIPVEEIAVELRVSRQPVMDALKRLSIEGFVSITPQVGCRVRSYQPEEVRDFFLLVAAGEALVAELAARRVEVDDIIPLRLVSGEIGSLAKTRRNAADKAEIYRALNRRLHGEIGRIARSNSLVELVVSLADRSDFFIANSGRPIFFERLQPAHREHEAIISAIERRDPENAARLMHDHIMAFEKLLREPALSATL